MTIACLGWGSLTWNPATLPVADDWKTDGPELPVEFARQSADGRITLVLTPQAASVPVLWVPLSVASVDAAIASLALREKIPAAYIEQNIGFWTAKTASTRPEAEIIGRWASSRELEGVVWTALHPKFDGVFRTPTATELVSYLGSLEGNRRAIAEEYVRKTPRQVMSAYRQAIEAHLGWFHEQG